MSKKQIGNFKYQKLEALKMDSSATPLNALMNLLRRDPESPRTKVTRSEINLNKQTLEQIANDNIQDAVDSDSIMQLLPDLELVETVYVGSILDPKSMSSASLTYTVDSAIFDSEISSLLLEPIIKYFTKDYKIDNKLDGYLSDCLFRKGSVAIAILPENILDTAINGPGNYSLENFNAIEKDFKRSLNRHYGFLGTQEKVVSLEGHGSKTNYLSRVSNDPLLRVTDNFNILKGPVVNNRLRELKVSNIIKKSTMSLESNVKSLSPDEIELLYNRRNDRMEPTEIISSPRYMERKSVGHPLIMELPSECVIPVFVPGKVSEHIGYFILVDNQGYPVSKDNTQDFFNELKSNWSNNRTRDSSSEIIRQTRNAMGSDTTESEFSVKEIQKAYSAIVTSHLHRMLNNGIYDQELDIGLTKDIQRIMLQRSWHKKGTQIVFVPTELMVYIAFDYNENGIGETLLARSKVIATMRSTLLMAETIGGMRNAIGRKKVRISLDADDPDPEQTISNIQSMVMESAMRSFPLAAPDPTQALDHLMRSGFDFEINTNSADYAETRVEFDDYNTNVTEGNSDLQDRLRRMHISGMGIPPEKVDPMSSPDFATSIVQNDLVLSRRVKNMQDSFCEHLSKLVKIFSANSSIIRNELNSLIVNNKEMLTNTDYKSMEISQIVDEFISAIEVSLPSPDNTEHEVQAEALDKYDRILTQALESYITSDLFPDEYLDVPGLVDQTIAQVKAHFIRQFMAQNNILPELNELVEMDEDKPVFNLLDWLNLQQSTLGGIMLEYARAIQKSKKSLGKEYKDVIEAEDDSFGESSGDSSSYSSGDDSDSESDDTDDFGGDDGIDDFDMDGLDDPMGSEESDQNEDDVSEEL